MKARVRGTALVGATALAMSCAAGLPAQQVRSTGAIALGCPEEMVRVQNLSPQLYHATGCSAGVDLVCTGGMTDLQCHPGMPHLLEREKQTFCEDHENQDHGPDAPTAEQYASLPAHGALPASLVRREMHRYYGLIRACFDCALARSPGLDGLVTARLLVGTDGTVEGVTVDSDNFHDPKLAHCIEGVVYDYRFPPPEGGGPFMTSFPFRLSGASDDAHAAKSDR